MTDHRLQSLCTWLNQCYANDCYSLQALAGDASFRRYFRVLGIEQRHLAVDMPPDKENLKAFVKLTTCLAEAGLRVPTIHHCSLEEGFLLIDDFGDALLSGELNEDNSDSLYRIALDALVAMQAITSHDLPAYDEPMLLDEARLFDEWYCGHHLHLDLSSKQAAKLEKVYAYLAAQMTAQAQTFVHRDYHSRNLICLNSNELAIIDYQDAVCGAISYDLVSLLKDCYIKWPREQQLRWLEYYLSKAEYKLDTTQFIRWFDLSGVQRHLKAIGIFARLKHRDGKAGYVKDIPRTLSYISELGSDYPELDDLQDFISGLKQ